MKLRSEKMQEDEIILSETDTDHYQPSSNEIRSYAEYLGMDLNKDEKYFYIAIEGLKASLPYPWKAV